MAYRRRQDRLLEALGRDALRVRVTGIAAGLQALVELPEGQREDDVVARAARHGLAVDGLHPSRATKGPHRPALVVAYATPPAHPFTGALDRLCAALADRSAGAE